MIGQEIAIATATAGHEGWRAQPEVMEPEVTSPEPKKNVSGTGSDRKNGGHVFWDGKPLTSPKKGIAGSEDMS